MATPSFAQEPVSAHVPSAEISGEGRFRHLLWNVYDAALYAPEGRWEADKPFALKLSYLMSLKGKAIADQSVKEMRKQGFTDEIKLAAWHNQMRSIFPDVQNGDTLTGIFAEDGSTIFYFGANEVGRVSDPEFSQWFFDIWLSPKTTAPELRNQLLGTL